jgi:hypothetical protein
MLDRNIYFMIPARRFALSSNCNGIAMENGTKMGSFDTNGNKLHFCNNSQSIEYV